MGLFSTSASPAMAAIFGTPAPREALKKKDISSGYQEESTGQSSAVASLPEAVDSVDEREDEDAGTSEAEQEDEDIAGASGDLEIEEERLSKHKRRNEEPTLEDQYFERLLSEATPGPEAEGPRKKKAKVEIDAKEKDKHTLFLGNVARDVVTDKKVYKQFEDLLAQYGEVVSVRFRSVAFSELLPRKAAFIQQKLHPSRDAVNAYVVYAAPDSAVAALKLNGEVFGDHHLRADSVSSPAPHMRKRSVFVGNLDFEAAEEPLYRHFAEAGPIEYVRIVRDAKTNVGKGFGYVQYADSATVQAALLLNGKDFGGRPLRVTRVKAETSLARAAEAKAAKVAGRPVGPAGRGVRGSERLSKSERKHKTDSAAGAVAAKGRNPARPRAKQGSFSVLEGTRAKQGETAHLGRKPRHKKSRGSKGGVRPGAAKRAK